MHQHTQTTRADGPRTIGCPASFIESGDMLLICCIGNVDGGVGIRSCIGTISDHGTYDLSPTCRGSENALRFLARDFGQGRLS